MKPEKRELARVVVEERGEVEDCEAEESVGEVVEGEVVVVKAVRSLRREVRGWRGWRRDCGGIAGIAREDGKSAERYG